jgi:hypothetical protein
VHNIQLCSLAAIKPVTSNNAKFCTLCRKETDSQRIWNLRTSLQAQSINEKDIAKCSIMNLNLPKSICIFHFTTTNQPTKHWEHPALVLQLADNKVLFADNQSLEPIVTTAY